MPDLHTKLDCPSPCAECEHAKIAHRTPDERISAFDGIKRPMPDHPGWCREAIPQFVSGINWSQYPCPCPGYRRAIVA